MNCWLSCCEATVFTDTTLSSSNLRKLEASNSRQWQYWFHLTFKDKQRIALYHQGQYMSVLTFHYTQVNLHRRISGSQTSTHMSRWEPAYEKNIKNNNTKLFQEFNTLTPQILFSPSYLFQFLSRWATAHRGSWAKYYVMEQHLIIPYPIRTATYLNLPHPLSSRLQKVSLPDVRTISFSPIVQLLLWHQWFYFDPFPGSSNPSLFLFLQRSISIKH